MGVASRDPDTSSVDAEKNDTLHSDTQREQAKGITKFFQSSTISQFESKSYFSEDALVFTMFGDSDVQNGAIWVQPSGLHMHHVEWHVFIGNPIQWWKWDQVIPLCTLNIKKIIFGMNENSF